jgi:hypothetical protein
MKADKSLIHHSTKSKSVQSKIGCVVLLIVNLALALVLLGYKFFMYPLLDALTPFIYPFVLFPIAFSYLILIGIDIYLLLIKNKHALSMMFALLIATCCVLAYMFLPLNQLYMLARFEYIKPELVESYGMLVDNQLEAKSTVDHNQYTGDMKSYMILDKNLRQAVGSGTIYKVDNQYCEGAYFPQWGFLDSEVGYLYAIEPPETFTSDGYDDVLYFASGNYRIMTNLGGGWYYISLL